MSALWARVTRALSRKHRGYATQRMLAKRWRSNGIAPFAKAVGAGEQGNDILDVPGLAVEVKARDSVSLPAALRQAASDVELSGKLGKLPVVIWRHNGQGEQAIGQWTATLSLEDFEMLWKVYKHESARRDLGPTGDSQ